MPVFFSLLEVRNVRNVKVDLMEKNGNFKASVTPHQITLTDITRTEKLQQKVIG